MDALLRTLDPGLARASGGTLAFARTRSLQEVAANLLLRAFQHRDRWPVAFVAAYLRDAAGLRTWVDSPACQLFKANILTAFAADATQQRGSDAHVAGGAVGDGDGDGADGGVGARSDSAGRVGEGTGSDSSRGRTPAPATAALPAVRPRYQPYFLPASSTLPGVGTVATAVGSSGTAATAVVRSATGGASAGEQGAAPEPAGDAPRGGNSSSDNELERAVLAVLRSILGDSPTGGRSGAAASQQQGAGTAGRFGSQPRSGPGFARSGGNTAACVHRVDVAWAARACQVCACQVRACQVCAWAWACAWASESCVRCTP